MIPTSRLKPNDYVFHKYIPHSPLLWVSESPDKSCYVLWYVANGQFDCLESGIGEIDDYYRKATPDELSQYRIGNINLGQPQTHPNATRV